MGHAVPVAAKVNTPCTEILRNTFILPIFPFMQYCAKDVY